MNKLTSILILLLGVFLATACTEIVEIPLSEEPQKFIIEGRINDGPGPYQVTVRKTTDIYASGDFPNVENAEVIVSDDQGNVDTLTEVSPGVYETNTLQGTIGNTYTLSVAAEGQEFTSVAKMNRIHDLDTLGYEFVEEFLFFEEGYYVTAFAQEIEGLGDYYRFLFIVNDSLYDDPNDIWFTDDRLVDGQLVDFQFPYATQVDDTVTIEIWSIEQAEYDYYFMLQSQANSAGNPFGSPPDNVDGNITNGALGYFGANAIRSASVVIEE